MHCFLDPPQNLEIDNEKEEYMPGEKITCSAEGNPSPTIYWKNEENDNEIAHPILDITTDMKGQQTYTCVAYNEIRGQIHTITKTLSFRVRLSGQLNFISYHME